MSIPKIEDLLDEIKELRAVLCEVLMAEAIPAEDEIYQSAPSSVWEILEENLCNRAGAAAKIRFTPSAEEIKRAEAWHLQHIIGTCNISLSTAVISGATNLSALAQVWLYSLYADVARKKT